MACKHGKQLIVHIGERLLLHQKLIDYDHADHVLFDLKGYADKGMEIINPLQVRGVPVSVVCLAGLGRRAYDAVSELDARARLGPSIMIENSSAPIRFITISRMIFRLSLKSSVEWS